MGTPTILGSKTGYGGPLSRRTVKIGSVTVALIRPAEPDRMLDDPEVLAWNRADDYMPYWAYLWPGAYLLAEAVAKESWLPGTPALEIGCGLGLAGLVGLARGLNLTFTDYDEAPFEFIERSAEASGIDPSKFQVARLDWRELPAKVEYPVIFGADVLYERRLVPLVANLLATLLAPGGTALIADPYRAAAEGFRESVESRGLKCEAESIEVETDELGRVRGTLHRVRRE